jgi:type VI secretion system protein ImpJ
MKGARMNANKTDTPGADFTAKPIFWHEGLFLQPHHFQWQDLYFQSLIEPLNRYVRPAMWGTGRIVIHTEALENEVFNVISGEFRFRDMTHVLFPGNAVLESRNFARAWKNKGTPFTVYLGIRKLAHTGKNVSDPRSYESFSMVPTRFTADNEVESLADFYEDSEALPVERLRYVLKLLWEDEEHGIGDFEVIPIARLETVKGKIVLSPDFIPPVLSLFSSESLERSVKAISELITSSVNRLEVSKRDRGVHTAEFGTKDMIFLLTLRTLNRFSPIFRHMIGTGSAVHPWTLYGVLCQLIGELSTFSSKINLVHIPKESPYYLLDYDHAELSTCFKRARTILARLMEDITADPEYVAPFVYDGLYHTLELAPNLLQGRKRYYLVVESEASLDLVKSELEGLAKLGSPSHLPKLVSQALPGMEIRHLEHPPSELPRRSMGMYFVINHQSSFWPAVMEEKTLALCWDSAPQDAKIELMIAGREA